MSTKTGDLGGLLDVVIPCYNDGMYLEEAIESLAAYPERSARVVVVNDGSTEEATHVVLQRCRARGMEVLDRPNGGLAAARNAGWRAGRAPFVLFLDADNKMEPGFLAAAIEAMMGDEGIAVVHGDRQEFGLRNGRVAQPVPTLVEELVGNRIDACAVVRRTVLEATGGFDGSMRSGYEDWEFWIRLMAAGKRFHHLPMVAFHYRVREGSLVSRVRNPDVRAGIVRHIVSKHHPTYEQYAPEVIARLHSIQASDQGRSIDLEQRLVSRDTELAALKDRTVALEAAVDRMKAEQAASEVALDRERHGHRQTLEEMHQRWRASKEALEAGEAVAEGIRRELVRARKENDALVTEAHRVTGEADKLMQALNVHREHARALQALIGQYEERIKAIESSKLWRLRRGYNKMRALLRTSSGSSRTGFRWLKRIAFLVSQKGRRIVRRFLAKVFRALYLMAEEQPVRILVGNEELQAALVHHDDPYHQWMMRHFPRASDLLDQKEQLALFTLKPLISVVMPVYDPPVKLLDAAIRSVIDQSYPHWELCIADDRSPNAEVRRSLERWMKADARIKVVFRRENGHISKASNSALELVEGEFTAFMDHDDLLSPDALFHIATRINRKPATDILYTDEDKVDEKGLHSDAHFKPQWCPDHLLSRNYFGHLVVIRSALVKVIGGFREGFEGSQDYDLVLRATERTTAIEHIPRVLYHWRIHAASSALSEDVKPYAYVAGRKSLTEALERRGEAAEVGFLHGYRGYRIDFKKPLIGRVSVIIPTKDKTDVLATCVHSIFNKTDHADFEVIVVSNNSKDAAFFAFMTEMERLQPGRFKWYAHDIPFNFSALMNFGTSKATGDQVLFLNNDTEVIHGDWMRIMHSWSQRPSIGAVGVKLLYHNDTIQHAGVIIGLGGVAGHTWVGYHKDGPGYFNYINTVNNNSAVTAACMMVERSKLERIGGWEELFTVEYNDVDLCLRLREAGFNNVYVPDVSLYHFESLTRGHPHMTKESYERHLREVGLFKERWSHYIADDPCYNPNLSRGVHDFQLAV
ncbi:MAG TPA: glycosyltransferase [Flavobacteriales bacterium]|nr:glycosyltransferase [Flavobacteriales bacterium]